MDRRYLKNTAKERLAENWMYAVIVLFVANLFCIYLPVMLLNPTQIFFDIYLGKAVDTSSMLSATPFLLIGPFVKAGLACFCIKTSRGEDARIIDLFEQNKVILKAVILSFLMYVMVLFGLILFVVPGIIVLYRYRFIYYVLVENPDMSVKEILKESARLVKGKKKDIFVLDLSFTGWRIIACLAFMIGNLWLEPYIKITDAVLYDKLKKEKQ